MSRERFVWVLWGRLERAPWRIYGRYGPDDEAAAAARHDELLGLLRPENVRLEIRRPAELVR
jgi:hypothetical protein